MKSINGKFLHVDLTQLTFEVEQVPTEFYRTYLGGRGFALPYLLKNMPAHVNPLGRDNLLILASNIISGAKGPAMPRYSVCAKSPLTNGFGESEAGGYWGPELKKSGFDAIIIKGQASQPVYIYIKNGQVAIKKANHLWGLDTKATQLKLYEELEDNKIRVLQIGPAGENQVLFANIVNELAHFNGRNGLGAVMGSKNLKAVVVRGNNEIELGNPKEVKKIARWAAQEGMKHPMALSLHQDGTPALVEPFNEAGMLPTRNFNFVTFKDASEIGAFNLNKTVMIKASTCYACPIRCKRRAQVKEGLEVDPSLGGPEYETVASLGSILEIANPYLLAKANELCNRYTMDTISTGMTIAFAIECYQGGLLSQEDCDGLELDFGKEDILLPLIKKIAFAEAGIGKMLGQGSRKASELIGAESKKYLREVKGQEVPMHEPRAKVGVGLQYALADYGADHVKAPHDTAFANKDSPGVTEAAGIGIIKPLHPTTLNEEKVRMFVYLDMFWTLLDSLGFCTFGYAPRGPLPLSVLEDLVQHITGEHITFWEMMKAGERNINLARIFNLREGFTVKDDYLPEIFFKPFSDGPNAQKGAIDKDAFQKAIKLRYQMMGWDGKTSHPQRAKLLELGIGWAEDFLPKGGDNRHKE